MRRGRERLRSAAAALLIAGSAGALFLLVPTSPGGGSVAPPIRPRPPVTTRPAPLRPLAEGETVLTVSCHATLPSPTEKDGATLAAAVHDLDHPGVDVRELRKLGETLDRLLMQRPDLGHAAVQALAATHERNVLFQLGKAIRAVVNQDEVRGELLALLAPGSSDEQQEAAVFALSGLGDSRADAAFTTLLGDEGAGLLARSAAAYGLGRDMNQLSPAARAQAVAEATALAASPATPEALQAESFGLLAQAGLPGEDRDLAWSAVSGPSDAVALQAAKALLFSGEDRVQVARTLRARGNDNPALLAQLDLLEGKTP
jgi:hypothetical protein